MPLRRPTIDEIRARTSGDVAGELSEKLGGGNLLLRSVPYLLSQALAGAAHLLYGFLERIAQQAMPDTAEDGHLERWARTFGVTRKVAAFADGVATLNGVPGYTVPAGLLLRREDGVEYAVTTDTAIAGETVTVPIEALEPGSEGNAATGTRLTLAVSVAGVTGPGTVVAPGIAGGAGEETDSELRDRMLERLRTPPAGGTAADYVAWAREVPGVTRAWCIPLLNGYGTVGLTFTRDADPTPIPDAGAVAEVQGAVDARRPVGMFGVEVFAPLELEVDFDVSLSPDTAAVRTRVTAALTDLLKRQGGPGTTITRSQISAAISSSPGEVSHVLTAPATDIITTQRQIAVMGDLTW